jgi:adenosylhomocysteine nucleosidase
MRSMTMLAVDIVSFSDPVRTDDIRLHLRKTLYDLLQDTFVDAGLPWNECHREDRGDGVLIAAPPSVPSLSLLDPLVLQLATSVQRHNQSSSAPARLRLRLGLHTGPVQLDSYGLTGAAVVHLFRLLDAAQFRKEMMGTNAEVGVIVSDRFYNDVVRHGLGMLDPAAYRPLTVRARETTTRAWVYLPGHAPPPSRQAALAGSAEDDGARHAEVGVVTVHSAEANAVSEVLGLHHVRIDQLPFMEGGLDAGGRPIRIAAIRAPQMGPQSTVVAFDHLRRHYSPAMIALTGIGGSIHPDVAVGDVVLTIQVVSSDQRREIPAGPRRLGEAPEAPAELVHALNAFFADHGDPATFVDETAGSFRVHIRPVGSSDVVIARSDSQITRRLAQLHQRTLAVEMEGSDISDALRAQEGGKAVGGWVIVRGISDDASEHKNDDQQELAARRAALVLRSLLQYLFTHQE